MKRSGLLPPKFPVCRYQSSKVRGAMPRYGAVRGGTSSRPCPEKGPPCPVMWQAVSVSPAIAPSTPSCGVKAALPAVSKKAWWPWPDESMSLAPELVVMSSPSRQ
jgi:hypothetical protein